MITLYSYPELFGVADNNGYGLKVYAFLKLACVPFTHEHVFDPSKAPRGQLPYIVDDGVTIGDSEAILAHLVQKYRLTIDAALTPAQWTTNHLITRLLDDLYWVMSYSRWKDDRFFPAFRDGFMAQHKQIDEAGLNKAREYNAQRYYFQGIGRYAPDQTYARGLLDLQVLADLVPADGYVHGAKPTSIDAGIYGFIANIHYYPIPDAAEGVRVGACQPGAALRGDPRGGEPITVHRHGPLRGTTLCMRSRLLSCAKIRTVKETPCPFSPTTSPSLPVRAPASGARSPTAMPARARAW